MKKSILLIVLLVMVAVLFGCSSFGVKKEVKMPTSLEIMGGGTVGLVRIDGKGRVVPYCTGVWISYDEILTAGHCIDHDDDEDDDIIVKSPVGDKVYYVIQREVSEVLDDPAALHRGEVKAYNKAHDLALIKAVVGGIPPHRIIELSTGESKIGDHVWVVGHPRGMYWSYSEGTISAFRNESTVGKVVQVNATVWYGNSGGGVFDKDGKLLGICSQLTKVPMMNYFIHLDNIKKFITDNES